MLPQRDTTSLEGFEQLWETDQTPDQITKQIQAILKVLVDDRIALKEENNLVQEFKQHINTLQNQTQRLNWQLGQREQELSQLHTEYYKVKAEKENFEKHAMKYAELLKDNTEIRRLAEQLSIQIVQEKSKNEQLIELLKGLEKPELQALLKKIDQ